MCKRKLTSVIFLCAMSLLITSCGPGQILGPAFTTTPTSTFTPTPTATFTPTATPTNTPTVTPTATPTPRPSVFGTLVDMETDSPLVGARVLLCKVDSEGTQCTVDEQLVDITDDQGVFEIPVVPGEYAVLYNTSGKPFHQLSGRTLDYRDPSTGNIKRSVLRVLLLSISDGRTIPDSDIDGCREMMLTPNGQLDSAYIYYQPYDLGLVMYRNKLVSIMVEDGPAEINLAVWNLQSANPSCSSFSPYR